MQPSHKKPSFKERMTKNPFLNALMASLYISAVSLIPYTANKLNLPEPEVSILAPIAFLSLFTLSAAFMAFTFFYQPVTLLLEGKKMEAFELLAKTIGIFAAITAIVFISLLLSSSVL